MSSIRKRRHSVVMVNNKMVSVETSVKDENEFYDSRVTLLHLFSALPPTWRMDNPLTGWEGVLPLHNFQHEARRIEFNGEEKNDETNGTATTGAAENHGSITLGTAGYRKVILVRVKSVKNLCGAEIDMTKLPNRLETLEVRNHELVGAVNLLKLPLEIRAIRLSHNNLTQIVNGDFSGCPTSLIYLELAFNKLRGFLDFQSLSLATLHFLDLSYNQFGGPIDLTRLPKNLDRLYLHHNQFVGPVNLTQLPGNLQKLHLSENLLSGSIDLSSLPMVLEALCLDHNQLDGTLNLSYLPYSLRMLALNHNKFSGKLDLSFMTEDQVPKLQHFSVAHNALSGEVDLTPITKLNELRFVHLNDNKLSGFVDPQLLAHISPSCQEFLLTNNHFRGYMELSQLKKRPRKLGLGGNHFDNQLLLKVFSPSLSVWSIQQPLRTWEGVGLCPHRGVVTQILLHGKGIGAGMQAVTSAPSTPTMSPPPFPHSPDFPEAYAGSPGSATWTGSPIFPSMVASPSTITTFRTFQVDFCYLPPTLLELDLFNNQIHSNSYIDLAHLPCDQLRTLILADNHFSGEVDLSHLPPQLTLLDLSKNHFSGPVDLQHLPISLTYLNLSANRFQGEIDAAKLPAGLQEVDFTESGLILWTGGTSPVPESELGAGPLQEGNLTPVKPRRAISVLKRQKPATQEDGETDAAEKSGGK